MRLRLYDAEFYSTAVTDVWVWEATGRRAWYGTRTPAAA
jgi:hypothetical protein